MMWLIAFCFLLASLFNAFDGGMFATIVCFLLAWVCAAAAS